MLANAGKCWQMLMRPAECARWLVFSFFFFADFVKQFSTPSTLQAVGGGPLRAFRRTWERGEGVSWIICCSAISLFGASGAKAGSKLARYGPKMAPRWPPDGPKMAPKGAQDSPRQAQDGSKSHLVAILCCIMFVFLKIAPREPQDGPRWPQDGPKMPQDGPKMPQDRLC